MQKVSARSSAVPTGTFDQMPRNAAKDIIRAGGRSAALLHCDGVGSFAAAAGVLLLGQLWGILATVSERLRSLPNIPRKFCRVAN